MRRRQGYRDQNVHSSSIVNQDPLQCLCHVKEQIRPR